jgi:hypothetical protein
VKLRSFSAVQGDRGNVSTTVAAPPSSHLFRRA